MRSRSATINTVSFFAFQDIITSVVGIFVLITLIMMLELVQTKVGSSGGVESVPAAMIARLEEMESEVAQLQKAHEKLQANAQKIAGRNSYTLEQELAAITSQQRELDEELQSAIKRTDKLNKQLENARQIGKQLVAREKVLASKREEAKLLADAQYKTIKASAILETEQPLIFRDQTDQGRYLVLVVLEKDAVELTDARTGQMERFTRASRIKAFEAWLTKQDVKTRQFLMIVKPSGEVDFEAVRRALTARQCVYGFDVAGEDQKFKLRSQLGGL